ncbi:MAG: hypothetical protein JO020_03970 [Chloroflexi bacterium]|nr:hypothetical protein [Chloroflexota bacterium]MBV9893307.1 hypothetical protein [Chloroflexota bacterium]
MGLLSQLVDKSLVETEPEPGGTVRYRMLETLRRYAAEQLQRTVQVGFGGAGHGGPKMRGMELLQDGLLAAADLVSRRHFNE